MKDYEAIELYIRRARIERSVYLADLMATALVGAWNRAKSLGQSVKQSVAQATNGARRRRNVFTFDA